MDGSRRCQGPHPANRQAEATLQPDHQDQPILLQSSSDFSPVSPGKPAQMTILAGHLQDLQRLQEAELPLHHKSCKPCGQGPSMDFGKAITNWRNPEVRARAQARKRQPRNRRPSTPESTPRHRLRRPGIRELQGNLPGREETPQMADSPGPKTERFMRMESRTERIALRPREHERPAQRCCTRVGNPKEDRQMPHRQIRGLQHNAQADAGMGRDQATTALQGQPEIHRGNHGPSLVSQQQNLQHLRERT